MFAVKIKSAKKKGGAIETNILVAKFQFIFDLTEKAKKTKGTNKIPLGIPKDLTRPTSPLNPVP